MVLVKTLAQKGDPGSVYCELWLRCYDEGFISISDQEDCAFASGYSGTRALRTWREHILTLAELGFIDVKPVGNKEIGHILLLNPLTVCAKLNANGRVTEEWWAAFVARATEVGAVIPKIK